MAHAEFGPIEQKSQHLQTGFVGKGLEDAGERAKGL